MNERSFVTISGGKCTTGVALTRIHLFILRILQLKKDTTTYAGPSGKTTTDDVANKDTFNSSSFDDDNVDPNTSRDKGKEIVDSDTSYSKGKGPTIG